MKKIFIIAVILLYGAINGSAQINYYQAEQTLTGKLAIQHILKKYNLDTSTEKIDKFYRINSSNENSMSYAASYLSHHILNSSVVKIPFNRLSEYKVDYILLTLDMHYVVVDKIDDKSIEFYDINETGQYVKKSQLIDDFKRNYSYIAIAISKENIPIKIDNKAPDFRVSSYTENSFLYNQAKKMSGMCNMWNEGTEDIIIKSITTDSPDVEAICKYKTLKKNCGVNYCYSFTVKDTSVDNIHWIYFNTNDPITPIVPIKLIARALPKQIICIPDSLDLSCTIGDTIHKQIFIHDNTSYGKMQLRNVKCANSDIKTKFEFQQFMDFSNPECASFVNGSCFYAINVDYTPQKVQESDENLIVVTSYPNNIKIPIKINVKRKISIEPKTAFFGISSKNNAKELTIKITSPNDEAFMITGASTSSDVFTTKLSQENGCYLVKVSMAAQNKDNVFVESVTLQTNTAEKITIPIYAIIQD